MASRASYFRPETLAFLRELALNNSREWFTAHKKDYEQHVKGPFLQLIADLAEPLKTISSHYVANPKPVGGSMFRIYRDTRFSGDKSPYKPWAGASFYHEATRAVTRGGDGDQGTMGRLDAPVFYLHIEPEHDDEGSFCGGGLWHPQPETVKRIRNYMLNNPASWKLATRSPEFTSRFGALRGESLSRVPRGYDPGHELVEDLKRKDFVCSTRITEATLLGPDLLDAILENYRQASGLIDWLCGALDLDY